MPTQLYQSSCPDALDDLIGAAGAASFAALSATSAAPDATVVPEAMVAPDAPVAPDTAAPDAAAAPLRLAIPVPGAMDGSVTVAAPGGRKASMRIRLMRKPVGASGASPR